MMHSFLANNRDELISRCKARVAERPHREATEQRLSTGVPKFLEQLTRTLAAEEAGRAEESFDISGGPIGGASARSQIGSAATAHGANLLGLGYTVDQVVHDYGDLCQSITDLAFERDAPFSVPEFRTLNRCLDNAIADAVLEFSSLRDARTRARHSEEVTERIGFVVHELRNALSTAKLAVGALEFGHMAMDGATGAVLKRAHASLDVLINRAIAEVRHGLTVEREHFSVASFIADAESAGQLDAIAAGCRLFVPPVDGSLGVRADRALIQAALANLVQNALKFTHAHTTITLSAFASGQQVLIEVHDHCGGLPPGCAESMFTPFSRRSGDRSGLGLGLAIARDGVESNFGTLTVRDVPATGCVFTIPLPLHLLPPSA
ncbi:MAG: HAMP domain-containing sensor histidine kinase [Burkholderiaceae bacterium]